MFLTQDNNKNHENQATQTLTIRIIKVLLLLSTGNTEPVIRKKIQTLTITFYTRKKFRMKNAKN